MLKGACTLTQHRETAQTVLRTSTTQRAPRGTRTAVVVHARRGGPSDLLDDSMNFITRGKIGSRPNPKKPGTVVVDPDADLITKVKAAWRIFFPEKQSPLSPKEEGKKRLRMILVADRCGMSTDSFRGMRESIVRAMSDFVEVEAEEAVEVNLSMDPEIGTIYSVAVPVKRVKPQLRPSMNEDPSDGRWDPLDPNSDPSDQFPYGT